MVFIRDLYPKSTLQSINLLLNGYNQKVAPSNGKVQKRICERQQNSRDEDMYVKSLRDKGYNDTQVLSRLLYHRQLERIRRKRITREKKLDINSLRRHNKNLRGKITQIKVRILENEDELANIKDRNKSHLKLEKENSMLKEKLESLKNSEKFILISEDHKPKREVGKYLGYDR